MVLVRTIYVLWIYFLFERFSLAETRKINKWRKNNLVGLDYFSKLLCGLYPPKRHSINHPKLSTKCPPFERVYRVSCFPPVDKHDREPTNPSQWDLYLLCDSHFLYFLNAAYYNQTFTSALDTEDPTVIVSLDITTTFRALSVFH